MNQNQFKLELNKINIDIDQKKIDQLEKYYQLLIENNKVMNLTRIIDHDEVYLKHFYDSLTINKIINLNEVDTLCDIGTGAGFPGIVLKILFPNLKVTLVDSLQKRINFLNNVIKKLDLNGIETIHSRIEDYGRNNREKFDVVTARAVAPTNILLEYAIAIIKVDGVFIVMKGDIEKEPNIDKSLTKLSLTLEEINTFSLPIEQSKRSLLKFRKSKKTSLKYPRKNKEIRNNPL